MPFESCNQGTGERDHPENYSDDYAPQPRSAPRWEWPRFWLRLHGPGAILRSLIPTDGFLGAITEDYFRAGRACRCLASDRRNEAIAASGDRLNTAASFPILIEDTAQGRDLHREVSFLDRGPQPDGSEDLVFSDELALPLDQEAEKRGGARTQCQRLTVMRSVFTEHAAVRSIEPEPLEEEMLGLGFIDAIQDREILAQHDATAKQRAALGITGHPNRSGNDGTIGRFGWKAQNKSLPMFTGEAYNVEMGITNELFPTATEEEPNCNGPQKPEVNDITRTDDDDKTNEAFANPLHILADWMQFSLLMRFTDAPQPDPNPSRSAQRGKTVFSNIGCALCHTPQMQTAPVLGTAVLENRPVNLFSDLLVHQMGPGLADDIIQGQAGPDEFRTQPLWGLGQRLFFLHDGRTNDLLQAIYAHRSPASARFPASEANAVINNFQNLPNSDQQAILDFLRSL